MVLVIGIVYPVLQPAPKYVTKVFSHGFLKPMPASFNRSVVGTLNLKYWRVWINTNVRCISLSIMIEKSEDYLSGYEVASNCTHRSAV